ncbi:CAF17-like 4Fe-4S cluster assembly/insertion protein YgfZ [Rickettsia endosymbiont of Orchestes rusci]|uniref:CAF17-like 4Fe-4S cluster assembly/insertion protein YgfZ n=1 Tax=Rickettsia endosymbiont of Orchestes rusci TaxID=3066250 RepID=UPI00313C7C96
MYEILNDRSIIEVTGKDAVKFLQNLTTNDLTKTNYCYTYLLNNQGRYLFDFFVFIPSIEQVFIDINKNNKEAFISHLIFYKLRSKIEITDLSDIYQVIYSHQIPNTESLIAIRDPRDIFLGFRSIISKGVDLKQNITTEKLYLEDKYNFSIIDGYEDLISNKSIPIEYGAEELNAISYDKGCYVGQEVISRAKYQGVIRKKIFKVSAEKDLSILVKEDEIFTGQDKIGVICSAYKNKAIALIREEKYIAKKDLAIKVEGIDIKLSLPLWYSVIAIA